ncbi:hypothetical protein [Methylosinus sp. Sm6]|uniref:hypothetical protein n=1 Tax=Methylosinus sp. Sm6 TaxID=2866948 RepID=UPI001C99DE24|nr:hypothetical protein [Methylosinus sp. Sm6]MBY6240478.1 hypothetical protein [Methylosinus sp. Sm6]
MAIQYAKSGKIIPTRFTLEEIEEASELMQGFCVACGAVRDCCEPDARRYECEDCGKRHVYGAEEIMLMGLVVES